MKKIAAILFTLIILFALVFTGYYYITQHGMLVREVYYNDTTSSQNPGVFEKQKDIPGNLLLDAVRSTEKVEVIPPGADHITTLKIIYWIGIEQSYTLRYNPYTGEGCIEKGLITPGYYKIPAETMALLLTAESMTINADADDSAVLTVNISIYDEIKNNMSFTGGEPDNIDDLSKYRMSVVLKTGGTLYYDLAVNMQTENIFVNTPRGYYSLSDTASIQILSLDIIYNEYKWLKQPYPTVNLAAGIQLSPNKKEINWERKKPTGEYVSEEVNEINQNIQGLESGTPLTVEFSDTSVPDHLVLSEYRNDVLYKTTDLPDTNIQVPWFEGNLKYVLEATYLKKADSIAHGNITKEYYFTISLPAESKMLYDTVHPGDTLAFSVDFYDEGENFAIESDLGGFSEDFSHYGKSQIIYMPVNWWTPAGEYYAKVYKVDDGTKNLFEEYTITVLPDNFETTNQQLVVSDELAEKADPVNTANDYVQVKKAKSLSSETSLVDGLFIMPLNGDFGTSYGRTRYINGENPYRHSGLDIDGSTGDPIIAANAGKVVFAGELVRTGNTVIIDHGMWLFSSYLHMSEIDVTVGDFVGKGELIGKVGSTGFSTGPHLHWSITLYGNYMSPLWLVENSIVPD